MKKSKRCLADFLQVDSVIKMPPTLSGWYLEGCCHMLLSFLAGIMPSLLLIKAVYCLGKGMMLGAVLETAIQFTKKFIQCQMLESQVFVIFFHYQIHPLSICFFPFIIEDSLLLPVLIIQAFNMGVYLNYYILYVN